MNIIIFFPLFVILMFIYIYKDFYQIVSLMDPYSNFKVTKLLIFHPDYNSFPNIQEIGEIILCKNVKVHFILCYLLRM